MALWAIVPVKPLRRGKSRLSPVLSEDDRAALNQRLLLRTVDLLKQIPEFDDVLVVSRDTAALALARDHGARSLQVFILPADLPQIAREDILTMLDAGREPPVVVIAPDHRREGTNALYINPAGAIEYDFGGGSFERHCQRARQAGINLKILDLPSLAHDVDVPEDLDFLTITADSKKP